MSANPGALEKGPQDTCSAVQGGMTNLPPRSAVKVEGEKGVATVFKCHEGYPGTIGTVVLGISTKGRARTELR